LTSQDSPLAVGTAGHIDHGKSALVRTLTGIDPDRLKEEQERGITIEPGFVPLLKDGRTRIIFVDVPGHERFIRNMLAGAAGIDAALFVVAADESVMPQTREHLDILSLLGIGTGIVAVTKVELADEEMQELTMMELDELLAGTFLDGAPRFLVDSLSNRGVDELKEALLRMAVKAPRRDSRHSFRLPVDRIFALKGFGTIVTGTACGKPIREGEKVRLYPTDIESRIRTIEVGGESAHETRAGERTALNLPDTRVRRLKRGLVAAKPGSVAVVSLLHVAIEVLPASPIDLLAGMETRLHLGAAETMARLSLLGSNKIEPGSRGFARLHLSEEVTSAYGDRFVLRRPSPAATVAGGRILLAGRPPRRLKRDALEELLRRLATSDKGSAMAALIDAAGGAGIPCNCLAALFGYPERETLAILRQCEAEETIAIIEDKIAIGRDPLNALFTRLVERLDRYHRNYPLRPGMSREAARRGIPAELFRFCVCELAAQERIAAERDLLRLSEFRIQPEREDEAFLRKILEKCETAGLEPKSEKELLSAASIPRERARDLLDLLLRREELVRVAGFLVHRAVMEELQLLLKRLKKDLVTVADFKSAAKVSRKFAIPFLEHLDATGVTVREGDARRIVLLGD